MNNPIHPGEILRDEFLSPLGISRDTFAHKIGVPVDDVYAICAETRGIDEDTAWALSKALGTTAKFWLNLQTMYDSVFTVKVRSGQ